MTGSQIIKMLSDIVDSLIIDSHPEALDDDLPDIMGDGDERDYAVDQLIRIIESYKGDL